jgi:hypothetical protein
MLGSNSGPLHLVHWQSDALTTRLDLISHVFRKKIKLEPEPDEGDCAGVAEASVKEDPEAHTRSRAVGRLPNSLLYPGTVAFLRFQSFLFHIVPKKVSISPNPLPLALVMELTLSKALRTGSCKS